MCDRIAIIAAREDPRLRHDGTSCGASAEAGTEGLEQIFLRLTGENAARELVEVLDA